MQKSTTTTLNYPEDFPLWEQDFIAGARSRDLWEYIRPGDERAPWPTRPSAPVMSDYSMSANVEPLEAVLTDLTATGRSQYTTAEQLYDAALKQYVAHRSKVTELTEWMRKTVHPNYRLTHMDADKTIDQWYDKLKELGDLARRVLKFKYKNEYEAFINATVGKPVKNLLHWTDEWLNKVTKAHADTTDDTESFKLITDLEKALRNTVPSWTIAFRSRHIDAITNNTLSYLTVANELRQEATVLSVTRYTGKLVKGGAFATFESSGDTDEHSSNAEEDPPRLSRRERRAHDRKPANHRGHQLRNQGGSSRSTSTKRPRADTRTESELENPNVADCIVCYGRHSITSCWFVFPELLPKGWKHNKTNERIAKLRMATEESVIQAVERARKQKRDKRVKFDTIQDNQQED
ncbi:hypothetical protein F5B21DRAFT_522498 [Xylaria acuta]|nr:hypothetical protein F5B21DRAFT_522498 [Xylaria acuta]